MIQDTIPPQFRPRRPLPSPQGVLLGLVLSLLLGMALTLQWLAWRAVGVESNGHCGGRYGGSCPQGSTPVLILSFLALFPLIPLTGAMLIKRFRAGGILGPAVGVVMVAVMVAGAVPGTALWGWAHGNDLSTLWTAPKEPSSRLEGQGSYVAPGVVVRARPDRLTAYDLATGRVRYTYVVPDPQLMCAMSRTAGSGVALIAYGQESGDCSTIAAIDLGTGQALWTKTLTGDDLPSSDAKDFVAVAGGMAVVRSSGVSGPNGVPVRGLQAFDLRTGAFRWRAKLADLCTADAVGGSAATVTAIVQCVIEPAGRITHDIRTYAAATGVPGAPIAIPYQAGNANIDALSFDPLVLHVRESTTRGTDRLYAADGGHLGAGIDVGGVDAQVTLDVTQSGWNLQPGCSCVVAQGLLIVRARSALNGKSSLDAYSLADGRKAWSHGIGRDDLQALTFDGTQVITLTEQGFREKLTGYRLPGGASHSLGRVQLDLLTAQVALYTQGGYYAILDDNGSTYPPVAVVR